jgi:hypothetical protein
MVSLIDSYEDLEDDIKTGSYNPFKGWKKEEVEAYYKKKHCELKRKIKSSGFNNQMFIGELTEMASMPARKAITAMAGAAPLAIFQNNSTNNSTGEFISELLEGCEYDPCGEKWKGFWMTPEGLRATACVDLMNPWPTPKEVACYEGVIGCGTCAAGCAVINTLCIDAMLAVTIASSIACCAEGDTDNFWICYWSEGDCSDDCGFCDIGGCCDGCDDGCCCCECCEGCGDCDC